MMQNRQENLNHREDLETVLRSYGFLGLIDCSDSKLMEHVDIVEEIIKLKQGDPLKVDFQINKTRHGFDFERPFYLYDDLVDKNNPTNPRADVLGFKLASEFSIATGIPLIEVLPDGVSGVVMLTGDDDQAYLEKYDEQLKLLKDIPVTYFLHPSTRHNKETLSKLSENVSFGVHPDALEKPEEYDLRCIEHTGQINSLLGLNVRSVRNHGYLCNGYQGHLKIWEELGLKIDVNLPGVDGTALNGSFLPMKVRREDGSWSDHYALLTAFGDGMVFAQNMTERQGVTRIKNMARQIEETLPGVLVFNFHPQNISSTRKLHKAVIKIAKRRNWLALSMDEYWDWLNRVDSVTILKTDKGFLLESSYDGFIDRMVLKAPRAGKWQRIELPDWAKAYEVTWSDAW